EPRNVHGDIIAPYGQWLLRSRFACTGRQTAVQSLPAGLAELGEDLEIPAGAVEDAARRKQYLIDVTSEACSTCRQLRVDRCIPAPFVASPLLLGRNVLHALGPAGIGQHRRSAIPGLCISAQ